MVRVFLLSNNGVFGQGLACLLHRQAGLEIVGQATDADAAIEQICKLKPAAVIIANGDPEHDPAMILVRVSLSGVKTRVIGLDLNSNNLTLYRQEQHMVTRVEDLVTAIEADATEQVEDVLSQS